MSDDEGMLCGIFGGCEEQATNMKSLELETSEPSNALLGERSFGQRCVKQKTNDEFGFCVIRTESSEF